MIDLQKIIVTCQELSDFEYTATHQITIKNESYLLTVTITSKVNVSKNIHFSILYDNQILIKATIESENRSFTEPNVVNTLQLEDNSTTSGDFENITQNSQMQLNSQTHTETNENKENNDNISLNHNANNKRKIEEIGEIENLSHKKNKTS